MRKNFRAAISGALVALLVSVPLSSVFLVSATNQDLARIDQVLNRYHDQVTLQTGKELQAALLASQLAGEQLSISFKTIDDQLVEIGEPINPISELPTDTELTSAESSAVTVKFSDDDQVRIRSIELADGEYLIFSNSLAEHNLAVAANQLTQYLVLAIAAIFGAVSGILIGRYQGNQLNLAILRQELDSERKNQETMRVFLGDVAHELKTPLTVIRGYSEMLERSSDAESADTAKPIKRIAAEVVRMEKLLAELLQLAQVREGAAQKPRELNLSEMLQAQLDDLSALQRGRKVTSEIEQVPTIIAPQLLVEMLLNNVFSNIRKHTEFDDSVHATLSVENDEVVLAVEDEGPGLPALLLEKQSSGELQRFTSIRNNQVEGQGLGLAIIRDVAEQIGAKVSFEKSERLGGLRVEFRFVNRAPQNGPAKKFGSNKLLK